MTREEAIEILYQYSVQDMTYPKEDIEAFEMAIKALEQEPCEDYISRANALRVAENEYSRGWHNALCKALSEKFLIHSEEGTFSVIQEETISGLGLLMNCAVGKDVENYMSTIPRVTPQEPILDKIRDEIEEYKSRQLAFAMDIDIADLEKGKQVALDYVLAIFDKYKAENKIEQGLDNADQDALMSAT